MKNPAILQAILLFSISWISDISLDISWYIRRGDGVKIIVPVHENFKNDRQIYIDLPEPNLSTLRIIIIVKHPDNLKRSTIRKCHRALAL